MHVNIIGQSKTGKTWLAEYMAKRLQKSVDISVFSPHYFGGSSFRDRWAASYATNKKEEFLRHVYSHPSNMVFIDEAADYWKTEVDKKLLTQGRHFGHCVFQIAQRYQRLDKTMRSQADVIFCFQVDSDDSKELAKEYINDDMKNAYMLQKYNCYVSIKSEPDSHVKINTSTPEGISVINALCDRFLLEMSIPTDELMKAAGAYNTPNWEFLKEQGFIY